MRKSKIDQLAYLIGYEIGVFIFFCIAVQAFQYFQAEYPFHGWSIFRGGLLLWLMAFPLVYVVRGGIAGYFIVKSRAPDLVK